MKYNELTVAKKRGMKRVGRGISAGQGKTAGRGTKGQKARTGAKRRNGFEGGQNPLMQRLPKLPGFRSFKTKAEIVTTGELEALGAKTADNAAIAKAGLVSSPYVRVKLVVKGDLTKPVAVKLQAASENAVAAVQKAGGSFERVKQVGRTATKKTDK
jgi:large subunit ribosomal protein L15